MNGMPEDETLLNTKQTLAYLGIGRTTLGKLIKEGKLEGHKVGRTWRFYRRDVRKLLMREEYAKEVASKDEQG
jgi:excisionase family DNA binding protein